MRTLTQRLRDFGAFWYDFVVGDDWRVVVVVVLALAATYGVLSTSAAPAWWIMPLAVVVILPARQPPARPQEVAAGTDHPRTPSLAPLSAPGRAAGHCQLFFGSPELALSVPAVQCPSAPSAYTRAA